MTIKNDYLESLKLQVSENKKRILVCNGGSCIAIESQKLKRNFELILKARGMIGDVSITQTGCFGLCQQGPVVKIEPDGTFYVNVTPKDAKDIVDEHIVKGIVVERLLYREPEQSIRIKAQEDIPFYKKQERIALKNCGVINPDEIIEYIGMGGYEALGKALQMSPNFVIEEVLNSGLRGRGGGGFLTGLKWKITMEQNADKKFIICNGDEGDPGAFMDRSILEGDPHSIIEGMSIGAYAIGAQSGVIYIRAEYPLAVERFDTALKQAREYNILGDNIFGTEFSFDIKIKYGAGAFVCGEETALINSCEGKRGEPNYKPPYPAEEGYWGMPTCVNNVETFANIPRIITNGAKWFSQIGTEKSKGTKVFALTGKINNVGIVEVSMGTTLREIIYDVGAGIKDGKKFKAVQTGGPSGGVIPEQFIDIPIEYDSLIEIGSMMGSGGMIVMDETDNMVEIAKFYLEFSMDESCGRCTPCRIGTKRLYERLCKILEGKGTRKDVEQLIILSRMIKESSLCGLGQTAPNPIISTLKYFPNEYYDLLKPQEGEVAEEKFYSKTK
jgi:NADH:ubiquinone oxidoreductase subunit F (NADH-binding)/(2Fe-2S) ferredoxin